MLELQKFYPELVHKIFVLNSPMFLETVYEDQLSQSLAKETQEKIEFSSTCSHCVLSESVDEHELPAIYGGLCNCKATCVYSEKGPWTEVENRINY